jgi:hypothetical protein
MLLMKHSSVSLYKETGGSTTRRLVASRTTGEDEPTGTTTEAGTDWMPSTICGTDWMPEGMESVPVKKSGALISTPQVAVPKGALTGVLMPCKLPRKLGTLAFVLKVLGQ